MIVLIEDIENLSKKYFLFLMNYSYVTKVPKK